MDLGDQPHAMIGLIARPAPVTDDHAIAAAVEAARDADVAVVVVGLTTEQETESQDKNTLVLPGAQDALVEAVAAAARRTVVVVNAATPVLMPWSEKVDAILIAGLPGQEGGRAVAAALLGHLEPTGRLVTTWPAADLASPAWTVVPDGGALTYREATFIGHRGHAAGRAPAPAFWFGAGLGYGAWEYLDARLDSDEGAAVVRVSLRNTSDRASRELVQVYLAPAESDQPIRLAGWAQAEVEAGETADLTVRCDGRMWRRWDSAAQHWDRLSNGGELLISRGLGDIRLRRRLHERYEVREPKL